MKFFYPLLLAVMVSLPLSAQILTRTTDLRPENYSIAGDAILEAYDDGSLKLRLSDDFTTPRGPDVRIYLGTGSTLDGGVEIVNLSTINHFSNPIRPRPVFLRRFSTLVGFWYPRSAGRRWWWRTRLYLYGEYHLCAGRRGGNRCVPYR